MIDAWKDVNIVKITSREADSRAHDPSSVAHLWTTISSMWLTNSIG